MQSSPFRTTLWLALLAFCSEGCSNGENVNEEDGELDQTPDTPTQDIDATGGDPDSDGDLDPIVDTPEGTDPSCAPNSHSQCDPLTGDVYWYDSCGVRGEMSDDCSDLDSCIGDLCVEYFNIYFSQNFEDDTLGGYSYSEWAEDWNFPAWSDPRDTNWARAEDDFKITEEDGNKFFRRYVNAGVFSTEPAQGCQWMVDIEDVDELYFSYAMRLPSVMFNQGKYVGGKIHGLYNPSDSGVGEKPSPDTGFNALMMFENSDADYTNIVMALYIYYQEMSCNSCGVNCADVENACNYCDLADCGSCGYEHCDITTQGMCDYCAEGNWGFECDGLCPADQVLFYGNYRPVDFDFQPDTWHTITQRLVMNDEWTSNGIIEIFIDGQLIAAYNDYRFRDTGIIRIEYIEIAHFFGGGDYAAPATDIYFDFDDFAAFTYTDGVEGIPRGTTPSPAGREILLPSL